MSESVLSGMFNRSLPLKRRRKASQSVFLFQILGWGSRGMDWVARSGEWSEESSRQDFATAKLGGIPLVTQKSMRSGRFSLSVGH
jgi:hypothetical protein